MTAYMRSMLNESGKLELAKAPENAAHPQLQQEDGRHPQPRIDQDSAQPARASAT